MSEKVTVKTTRPVLFEGEARTSFETTDLHRRELRTRGLLDEPAESEQEEQEDTEDRDGPTAGETFVNRKAAEVIAAIVGADNEVLKLALEAEQAKGDKARSTVVDALTTALAPSED